MKLPIWQCDWRGFDRDTECEVLNTYWPEQIDVGDNGHDPIQPLKRAKVHIPSQRMVIDIQAWSVREDR